MKETGVFAALIVLLLAGHVNCQTFDFTVLHHTTTSVTATSVLQVAATYSGVTGDVCADGIHDGLAHAACGLYSLQYSLQYYGYTSPLPYNGSVTTGYSHLTSPLNTLAFADVSCPSGLNSCTGNPVTNCNNDGGLLTIQCILLLPECYYNSHVKLSNPVYTSVAGGGYYLTGHPVACVNGSFIPICSNVNLGIMARIAICLYSVPDSSLAGSFIGAPSGVTVPPPTLRFNDTVITGLTCPHYLSCSGTSTTGTCSSGYATLTCQKVCTGNDTLLFNMQNRIIGSNHYVIGIPQFCSSGTYARICNDGTNHPNLPSMLCIGAGLAYGEALPSNSSYSSLYSGSPQGLLYLSNFTCPDDECEQHPVIATNPQCYSGQLEMILQCSIGIPCNGTHTYLHNNVTMIANGREVVTGIPMSCVNGQYSTLCNDGMLQQSGFDFLCKAIGFDNVGVQIPLDTSLYGRAPSNSIYYSNLTCPPNAISTDDCLASIVYTQQCRSGSMDTVLQCSRVASTIIGVPSSSSALTSSSATITLSITSSSSTTTSSSVTPSVGATSGSSTGVIVGVTVGILVPLVVGVVIIILVFVIVYFVMSKRNAMQTSKKQQPVMAFSSVSKNMY